MIRIAVPGINGRMGAAIAEQVLAHKDLCLSLATARSTEVVGQKVANSELVITAALEPDFDVLIDFTLPAGVMEHLDFCVQHNKAMVIGVTGCNAAELAAIKNAAQLIPIVMSSNMSVGVNICFKILAQAAPMFDPNWDVAVSDVHHQHKKDSPSGTAKQMLKILEQNLPARTHGVLVHSERHGEVVGDHSVTFSNPMEEIIITHSAKNRAIFAQGAVLAARWVSDKKPGLFSMLDVIA